MGGKDEAKRLTGCEVGSVWKVPEVVNRMHFGTHAQTHTQGRKEQALTSDSPGRPQPESDTFCRLKHRRNERHNRGEREERRT